MAARARLTVRGRVQGVWYRGSMQEEARRLHVAGWVRNDPDGGVSAEAEGERAAVEALFACAHHCPPGAHVTGVDVEWVAPTGQEQGRFAIRH